MLLATVAERTVELVGCDTMLHAEKFEQFVPLTDRVDQRITVETTDRITPPDGKPLGSHRMTTWCEVASGQYVLSHTQGLFQLHFNDDFSDVRFFMSPTLPKADILQYLYVSQCMNAHALANGGIGFHGAGLCFDEQSGVLLVGTSGTGKSTLTTALSAIDPTMTVLCEETVIGMKKDDGYRMYGTPLCGGNDRFSPRFAPLRGVVILRRGDTDRFFTPSSKEAFFGLLETAQRPVYHRELCETAVDRIADIQKTIPIYGFDHTAGPNAGTILYRALEREGLLQKGRLT